MISKNINRAPKIHRDFPIMFHSGQLDHTLRTKISGGNANEINV